MGDVINLPKVKRPKQSVPGGAAIIQHPAVAWCEHCEKAREECLCYGVCIHCGGEADYEVDPYHGMEDSAYWCEHCQSYSIIGYMVFEVRRC